MSCYTEHKMVILHRNKEVFENDFSKFKDEYRLSHLYKYHENENYIIYTFSCNGDGPWYLRYASSGYEALEINYFDAAGYLTEVRDGKGVLKESSRRIGKRFNKFIDTDILTIDKLMADLYGEGFVPTEGYITKWHRKKDIRRYLISIMGCLFNDKNGLTSKLSKYFGCQLKYADGNDNNLYHTIMYEVHFAYKSYTSCFFVEVSYLYTLDDHVYITECYMSDPMNVYRYINTKK